MRTTQRRDYSISEPERIDSVVTEGSDVKKEDFSSDSGQEEEEEEDSAGERADEEDANSAPRTDAAADEFEAVLRSDWTEDFSFFPLPHPFTDVAGIHTPFSASSKPVDVFTTLFDNTMLTQVRDETNRYAEQNLAGRGPPPQLKLAQPSRGEVAAFRKGGCCAILCLALYIF